MNTVQMTYENLKNEIVSLSGLENVDMQIIGHSVQGQAIKVFHIGAYGENQIIITGAIHAREWVTALLIIELIKIYRNCDLKFCGIFFIPLCNPDGVRIALDDGEPLWKANARGVDLNVNFDADWGMGASNVREPGPENFIGPYPNSEPEVKALINFTLKVKPCITIAYHSKGEVIYYGFKPTNGAKSKVHLLCEALIAKKIGKITGYTPEKTANSTGGYSDWVSMNFGIPAFTIEVGNDDYPHPIGTEKLPEILFQNLDVPKTLLSIR